MSWIAKTLLSAVAVFFISWLLPGVSIEESYFYAILVAIVIAILNSTLKPLLVLLTLPATILSLGLFMWVINAFVILAADWFLDGFTVDNFWWALLFSALLSMINSFLHKTLLHQETRTVNVNSRRGFIASDNSSTTVSGNRIKVENGKKTIIIEKD